MELLRKGIFMHANDIGIDLGTTNCLVYSTGKGLVLQEPSVVVYDKDTEKIRAIGEEAKQMSNHVNSNMEVIRPIRQGVIVDFVVLEKMLKYFITKAMGRRAFRKPRISVCVPSGITEIERKAVEEATYQAGAREVYLVEEPIAAAIGAGVDITKPFGNLIVSGDTKVAGKGQVDGVFITTTGMGQIEDGVKVGGTLAQPGDAIIVTGDVGRHGCTILLAREDFGIEADVTSDCAPLWKTVEAVMNTTHDLHVIRDATRGGVGTVLYEIAGQSNVGIRLDAAAVPVAPEVKGVC